MLQLFLDFDVVYKSATISPPRVDFIFENIKNILTFSIISRNWDGTGNPTIAAINTNTRVNLIQNFQDHFVWIEAIIRLL